MMVNKHNNEFILVFQGFSAKYDAFSFPEKPSGTMLVDSPGNDGELETVACQSLKCSLSYRRVIIIS